MKKKDITHFYTSFATEYGLIANDRNFSQEVESLFSNQKNGKSLELFAGPAYHSIESSKIYNFDTWAIDSSMEMKELALKYGFPRESNYIIGNLPDALNLIPLNLTFDFITCFRFSIGYISLDEVYILLSTLKKRLTRGGKIILELHKVNTILKGMDSTSLRERIVKVENENKTIRCTWPKNSIVWADESFKAEMNVELIIEKNHRVSKTIHFSSHEYIHTVEVISFVSQLCGYNVKLKNENKMAFKNSKILILKNG